MDPENHASLMGRNSMLARGTLASSAGRCGTRFAALRWSNSAMAAAPSPRTDAIGMIRSRRHASTACSSSASVDDLNPARPSSSATRARFDSGRDGSGGLPVEASTLRGYGTGAPLPSTSIARSHMASMQSAKPSRYDRRSLSAFAASLRMPRTAFGKSTSRRYNSAAWRSTFLLATPPQARSRAAAGCVYDIGSDSSENHESAMNLPVPDGHITSPPHNVSMPSTASATYFPTC